MTLALELGGIQDRAIRTAFEQIAQHFPLRAADMSNEVFVAAVTPATRARVSWGAINTDGTTAAGSGDFTSAKTATGLYTITWAPAKKGTVYAINLTPDNAAGTASIGMNWRSRAAASFGVTGINLATVATADASFCFVVHDAQ